MLALIVIAGFMVIEIIGGIFSGSLALLADASHMATDAGALALALGAKWLAGRDFDRNRLPYGYRRAGVLAGFVNGLLLLVLVGWLVMEAFRRFLAPQDILTSYMLIVAIIGLAANIVAFMILHGGDRDDINMRGAMLHVMSDIFGSVAAILSAILIAATGRTIFDPLLTLVVCALILRSVWPLLKQATHILLQGAPGTVKPTDIEEALHDLGHVAEVRNVRIWMLTAREVELSVQVVLNDAVAHKDALEEIKARLAAAFDIHHSTIEVCHDDAGEAAGEGHPHGESCSGQTVTPPAKIATATQSANEPTLKPLHLHSAS